MNHCENAVFLKYEKVKVIPLETTCSNYEKAKVNLCENAVLFPKCEKVKVNLCEKDMFPHLESGTGGVEG